MGEAGFTETALLMFLGFVLILEAIANPQLPFLNLQLDTVARLWAGIIGAIFILGGLGFSWVQEDSEHEGREVVKVRWGKVRRRR